MSRFVIRNPAGRLYSGNEPEATWSPSPTDPSRNDQRFLLTPLFQTEHVAQALKHDSAEDAAAAFAHPDLKDPAAFAGCEVMEVEFDRQNPEGLRAPA